MAGKNNNILEYREMQPSELEEVSKLYETPVNCIRVGPKGYYVLETYKEIASDILDMKLREGDIFVTTYQRSGTTFTQELVWLLANDFDYERAAAVPLTDRFPFLELSMFFDETAKNNIIKEFGDSEKTREMVDLMSTPVIKIVDGMPSPRFVKSHLPLSLLPPKLLDTAKVVYVARDPRDVAVSCFHHARLFKIAKFIGNFKQTWSAFIKDLFMLTPYFEHVKEAWALKDHPNMLFLFYEDMSKDMPTTIKRVADFLGKDVSPAQVQRLCEHLSIDNFKNNMSVNYENMRDMGMLDSREQFIRKGKAGGWRSYFDEEMMQEAERWIKKNLQDTDLRFPSMDI